MSEINQVSQDGKSIDKPITKIRYSKIPLLLALLGVASSACLTYQALFGKYNVIQQTQINQQQSKKITELQASTTQLQLRLITMESQVIGMRQQLNSVNPTQSSLVVYQLNSLISGANQSLLLYHDSVAAIKQLNYAKNILATTDDARFSQIKINLTKDLGNLEAQNSFDSTVVATQLDELGGLVDQLSVVAPVSTVDASNDNGSTSAKIIRHLKNSLFSLVKISKANPDNNQANRFENDTVMRQHLQLDILNSKQALLTHNQQLWLSSLSDSSDIIQKYFVNDAAFHKSMLILKQLQTINFGESKANLDLTVDALGKLEQLSDWKQ